MTAAEVAGLERLAAAVDAAVAAPLAALAPDLAPVALPLGGGQLVLLGRGMYVNRAIALGLGIEVTDDDLDTVEAMARSAGVAPEIEVSPLADPSLLECAGRRGYVAVDFRTTLLRPLDRVEHDPVLEDLHVEEVTDEAGLAMWQATMAQGFGATTPEERRISDLYVAALHRLDATRLYLARRLDEPVGVASLATRGQLAVLGGMATIPSARGRGVQAALIRHRLCAAATSGCTVAMSTTHPASGSERNLLRSGFGVTHTTLKVRRHP